MQLWASSILKTIKQNRNITNMHSKLQKHQFTMHFLNFAFFNYAHSATMLCLYNCSKMRIMYLMFKICSFP